MQIPLGVLDPRDAVVDGAEVPRAAPLGSHDELRGDRARLPRVAGRLRVAARHARATMSGSPARSVVLVMPRGYAGGPRVRVMQVTRGA